jgi:hypothetical protein
VNTGDTRFSVPAVWSRLYNELKGSPWEAEDLDAALVNLNPDPAPETRTAAQALKTVYDLAQSWQGVDPEDAVRAVLKAAHRHHRSMFLTPAQVVQMAAKFTVFYAEPDEPLEDYLLEHYNGIPLEWLTDTARREVEKAVIRESEIWIWSELDLSGVWVFDRP